MKQKPKMKLIWVCKTNTWQLKVGDEYLEFNEYIDACSAAYDWANFLNGIRPWLKSRSAKWRLYKEMKNGNV